MDLMIEAMQGRHREILSAFDGLSRTVVADAEGTHSLQLMGFLRHRLLPHMHCEESELYRSIDRLMARPGASITATMAMDHELMEQQIARIDESLNAVTLEPSFELQHGAPDRNIGFLLAQFDLVLRLHLRREEHLYLTAFQSYAGDNIASDIWRRM